MTNTITHWINNEPVAGSSSATAPVTNPATGEVTGEVALASVEAVRTGAKVAVALHPRPVPEPQPGITAPDLEAARP